MSKCKDCDGPLTTYQGFDPFKAEEVFCAYCEANPPEYVSEITMGSFEGEPDIVQEGAWNELGPNEYVDFGKPFALGPEHREQSEDRISRIEPSDNFAERMADMIFKNANTPWRETSPVWLSLHVGEPERGNEIGDLIRPGNLQWYERRPTTFSSKFVNEHRASWEPDAGWRITHFGVYDAKRGGNLLFHSPLDVPMEIQYEDTIEFKPGSVQIKIT